MRHSNFNLVEAVGGHEIEWLAGSRWISQPKDKIKPHSPTLLVVDDEPAFDKRLIEIARKNGIKATACQSVIEARALFSHSPYDVAIVSDDLGGITKGQLWSFLEKDIPLVLMTSDECACELERNFPCVCKKVVTKKEGPEAIVAHALQAMRVSAVSSEFLGTLQEPILLTHWGRRWLILTALFLLLSLALSASALRNSNAPSNNSIDRWDKLSIAAKVETS